MSKDSSKLQVLAGKKIVRAEGDHIVLNLYLDDGSTIVICSAGQERLEVTRSAEELVSEKKMVTKDLV